MIAVRDILVRTQLYTGFCTALGVCCWRQTRRERNDVGRRLTYARRRLPSVGCSSFVAHDFLVLFYSGPVRPTARRMSDTVGYALTLIRPFQFISFDDAAGFRNEMMCSRRRALSPSALFERCLRALSPSVLV